MDVKYSRVLDGVRRKTLGVVGMVLLLATSSGRAQAGGPERRIPGEQPDFQATIVITTASGSEVPLGRLAKRGEDFRLDLEKGSSWGPASVILRKGKLPYELSHGARAYGSGRCVAVWAPFAPWLDFARIASDPSYELRAAGAATIDGHPCTKIDVRKALAPTPHLTLYAATGLENLIIRVDADPRLNVGTGGFQIPASYRLVEIRTDVPRHLVRIPRGFKEPDEEREPWPVCIALMPDRTLVAAGARVKLQADFADPGSFRSYYR